jgi:hypothetical protein
VAIEADMTALEHFQEAILVLVRAGAIKDRVGEAYREHLAQLSEEDLPRELREEFRALCRTLTRERPMRGEDAARATLRKMSLVEAESLALTMAQIFGALPRGTLTARHSPSAQVVPLHLAEATNRA